MSTSIIIYAKNVDYLDKTIDSILNNTPPTLISDITVCNDNGIDYKRDGINVITSSSIGKAKAWNRAFDSTNGDTVIFVNSTTKFSVDWIQPLLEILKEEPSSLVTPIVHGLDAELWMSEPNRFKRFGWRWDLKLYDRPFSVRPDSPAISSNCIATNRKWFTEIGRFDDGMGAGAGEDIELSIRNWLLGGFIFVADESIISCANEVSDESITANNHARIIEVWLREYASLYYNIRNIEPVDVNTGRLSDLLKLRDRQKNSIEWYLSTYLPELGNIYSLRNTASKKRVAVVGPSVSLDYVDNSYINSFDIVIGVDYVGKLFDCDYILADSVNVITEMRYKYKPANFVLPMAVESRVVGELIPTSEIIKGAFEFELGIMGDLPSSLYPPFCHFDNLLLTAIHFALFLNPSQVVVFGADNKFVGGRSHTSKIDSYEDGRIFSDSDNVRRNFAAYEYCLDHFGKLGNFNNIPVLRLSHA